MTDKPGRHYRCSSCQETPKTDSLHPPTPTGQGEKPPLDHQVGWGGLILLRDHDSAFRRDYKRAENPPLQPFVCYKAGDAPELPCTNTWEQGRETQPRRSGWQLWKCSTRIMGAADSPVSVLSSDATEGLEILFQFGPFPQRIIYSTSAHCSDFHHPLCLD